MTENQKPLTIRKVGIRNVARWAWWIATEGWHPTNRRCSEHANRIYARERDEQCSGELYNAWLRSKDA